MGTSYMAATYRSINELHDQFCPIMHKGTMRDDVQEASPALLVNPRVSISGTLW